MKIDYSKPSGDVRGESLGQVEKDRASQQLQTRLAASVARGEPRVACVVCGSPPSKAEAFTHRSLEYLICGNCGHLQSRNQPPPGYPHHAGGIEFNEIYPKLESPEYASRRDRIYQPKLDWALSCHQELGRTREALVGSQWLELGCGAGYFLSALRQAGATGLKGLERDRKLVELTNAALPGAPAQHYEGRLSEAVRDFPADVYVAFFVLEHVEDTRQFFLNMKDHKPGTLFLFSVPVFGMSTIMESAIDTHSARCLDSVFHTQLYTDRSIDYCLDLADYQKAGEWFFGQDSIDFRRLLLVSLREKYGPVLWSSVASKLDRILDPLQAVFDAHELADSRHILAVKR